MAKNGWLSSIILFAGACCILLGLPACQKDQLSSDNTLSVYSSTDSVSFDQVFTRQVQPTQTVKLFNGSAQAVNIQHIQLAGGLSSPFKINVNGQAGTDFDAVSLAKADSLYIFVTVTLPEHSGDAPFAITDSIEYQYGSETGKIILSATGLNAYYLSGGIISADTTWTAKRPIVINGNITVSASATLHIRPGTKIYTRAGKSIRVNGQLQALGTFDTTGQILMTGSRLDQPYDAMPGSWQGLSFGPESKNNTLNYVHIKNAVNGIADTSRPVSGIDPDNSVPLLTLQGCVILQSAKEGLLLSHSHATLSNCLIYNCGIGLRAMGGKYALNYVTMAGYSNDRIYHTNPLLYLADHNGEGQSDPLTLTAVNCIFTGDNDPLDELYLDNLGNAFTLAFKHSLIKAASLPALGTFTDCLMNLDPAFLSIDNQQAIYNFQLLNVSPLIGAGVPISGITEDILHQERSATAPTIGCYEFKEATTL